VSHAEGRLYRITPDGAPVKILDTTVVDRSLADFEYLPDQGLLIAPTFSDNRVTAYRLAG
jgi:hypothetical protein